MAFCIHCGSQISDGDRFCQHCGKPAQEAGSAGAATQAAFSEPAVGPPSIQETVPVNINAGFAQASAGKKKSRKALVLAGGAVLLALVLLAVTLLWSGGGAAARYWFYLKDDTLHFSSLADPADTALSTESYHDIFDLYSRDRSSFAGYANVAWRADGAWLSDDGKTVIYRTYTTRDSRATYGLLHNVYRRNLDKGEPELLAEDLLSSSVSPDMTRIAYVTADGKLYAGKIGSEAKVDGDVEAYYASTDATKILYRVDATWFYYDGSARKVGKDYSYYSSAPDMSCVVFREWYSSGVTGDWTYYYWSAHTDEFTLLTEDEIENLYMVTNDGAFFYTIWNYEDSMEDLWYFDGSQNTLIAEEVTGFRAINATGDTQTAVFSRGKKDKEYCMARATDVNVLEGTATYSVKRSYDGHSFAYIAQEGSSTSVGTLYHVDIKTGDITEIDTDVKNLELIADNDDVFYMKAGSDDSYDLYVNGKLIDENVEWYTLASFKADGFDKYYYLKDYDEDTGGWTLMSYKNGKVSEVSQGVWMYGSAGKDRLLLLKEEGTLYLLDGKKETRITSGVQYIVHILQPADRATGYMRSYSNS
ncbi:MAG: zinc ribbon domain-containing protein [Clostridiales Family XIII bacterium]|jgi:hypothetical protein|nr:zinc ribbon domain-containing protein [Clostridiales Family XIII bacterium]